MEDIGVRNFRQERFMLRHLRQWSKNFGFGSALSHNSGAANTILFTIQTFNKHSRMTKLSQPYLRGHMRWNVTSLQVQLGLIGTYNFGRLSTLKSNILSTRKLRVLWPQGRRIRGFQGARAPPEHESAPSHYQKHSLKMKGNINETPLQNDIQQRRWFWRSC